ncbi:nucleoside 2-deoxyribosyltransferase [Lactobacillus agrestimuris]|uniref:nucleoside 2-deoxyribosyltransferase n=1 Tax=Lactobacillus agrestimuris TaxID=2941328 RepID=UPI0020443212|nr:nucleoside 2-deoxyribosyltransferase [Lactobacillus agrestimuris]
MKAVVPTGRIYLGSPFYNEAQRGRVDQAKDLLSKNPSIAHIFFPFDAGFTDPAEENPEIGGIRSMVWRDATYQNDLTGIVNASCGVFLYDMDNLDDGSAFEIGFMRAMHKPVVLVPFTEHPEKDKVMNLMLAQGVTTIIDGNTELEKLSTYDFNECPSNPVVGYKII